MTDKTEKMVKYIVLSSVNFVPAGGEIELTEAQAARALARGDLCEPGDKRAKAAIEKLAAYRALQAEAAANQVEVEAARLQPTAVDVSSRAVDAPTKKGARADLSGS